MTVDATLAAIDGALDGRVICDGGQPLWPERWNVWRHGTWSYRVTPVPAIQRQMDAIAAALSTGLPDGLHFAWGPAEPAPPRHPGAVVAEIVQGLAEASTVILAGFGRAVGEFAKPFARMAHEGDARRNPRQHIRCRRCNPAGNALPLAVNGREYRRRQRARRRRRR